jgi:hypothetical protein
MTSTITTIDATVVEAEIVEDEVKALTRPERKALTEAEAKIEAGLQTFYDVGNALAQIRDRQLYRESHPSFQAYADQRWGIGKSYTSRLIGAAGTINNLIDAGMDRLPDSERHTRPMLALPAQAQRLAWGLVLDQVGTGKVNTTMVEAAVAQIKSAAPAQLPAAKPRKQRVEHDFYETDERITDKLLQHVDIQGRVFECCAGEDAIVRVLRRQESIAQIDRADLYRGEPRFDAADRDAWSQRDLLSSEDCWAQDWTITNPPFTQAVEILDNALRHSRIGVAFLLPISFLEPTNGRGDLLQQYADCMTQIISFNPRPVFREDGGGDRSTVAWFVWQKGFSWRKDTRFEPPFQFVQGWR